MRTQMIAGILFVALGLFIVLRGPSYGSQHSVIQVGDLKASVDGRRTIPSWIGAVAIVGGVLLVGVGLPRTRSRT